LLVASMMWLIQRWHAWNHIHHRDELARLLHIARHDDMHG
jgi:hypothetical protein